MTDLPQRFRLLAMIAGCLLPMIRAFADAEHIEKDDGLTIIRMEVTPADEPVPAFKHRLVYDAHQRLPGNRPQWYMRAYPEEFAAWTKWRDLSGSGNEDFDRCYQSGTPVSKCDWERFDTAHSIAHSLFKDHIIPGSKRRSCDWGIRGEAMKGPDAILFLLPEFQGSRSFARMSNLLVRRATAEGRYEDAIECLRAEYQLGRDVAEEHFLVCTLVGIAITGIANSGVTDLIAAPGSPNLYWALSELPSPPVSINEAINGDLSFAERVFPDLADAEAAERTTSEWNAVWRRLGQVVDDDSLYHPDRQTESLIDQVKQSFFPALTGVTGYTHAKQRLVDWGYESDRVESMAVGQVLTIYTSRVIRIASDSYRKAKATGLTYNQVRRLGELGDRVLNDSQPMSDGPNREIVPIGGLLLPASSAARSAEYRCARDVAALRVIEALRMHAAQNDKKFPRSLEDVTCVPVPENPATDKPFLYHRDGRTAVLDLPDWEGFPGYSRRYEITIKQ